MSLALILADVHPSFMDSGWPLSMNFWVVTFIAHLAKHRWILHVFNARACLSSGTFSSQKIELPPLFLP